MKAPNLPRPDKLIMSGLKTLGSLTSRLYTEEKTDAKAKAEVAFIGKKRMDKVDSQLYRFDLDECHKTENPSDLSFIKRPQSHKKYWFNIHGIHDVKILRNIGDMIGLDRLTIRQILDTTQRPKITEYLNYLFLSVKSVLKRKEGEIDVEQISFILGPHFIVSFQEEKGDHFNAIRNKLTEGVGFIRSRQCDYLLFQLLDAILDNYFETIEKIHAEIAELDKILIAYPNPDKSILLLIESHKRSVQLLKKALGPFKEVLLTVMNEKTELIENENLKFFRDLTNSVTTCAEEVESTLRNLEGLTNIYFASLSQKMNEVMKVLTTVATIFIPLTFIAGIYGMNFDNMPELHHPYGYFMILGFMALIFLLMLVYFRKNRWL